MSYQESLLTKSSCISLGPQAARKSVRDNGMRYDAYFQYVAIGANGRTRVREDPADDPGDQKGNGSVATLTEDLVQCRSQGGFHRIF